MKAEAILKCSMCGNEYSTSKLVENEEEKESWEKWALEVYGNSYCNDCRTIKARQMTRMKKQKAAEAAGPSVRTKGRFLPVFSFALDENGMDGTLLLENFSKISGFYLW